MSITRLIPGGDTVRRLSPGGETITRLAPGGELIARSVPGGESVTRIIPPTAAEEEGDRFADYINDIDSLAAWWSPNGAEAGNLADDDIAMKSMGPTANPDIVAIVASTGNILVVADDIGTTGSLKSAIQSIQIGNHGSPDDFMAIDAGGTQSDALDTYLTTQTGAFSGFCFFKNSGASWASANYGSILQFYGDSDSSSGSTSTNGIGFRKGGGSSTTLADVRISSPNQLDFVIANAMALDTWYFIGWRQTSEDNFSMYVVAVGDDWSNADTADGASAHSKDGLNLGMGMNATAGAFDGWRWGPFGLFSADITESVLQDIFELIE